MAYRSPPSSCGSQSPAPSSASSNVSPASNNVPLVPTIPPPDSSESRSARASPHRFPVDLARSASSKGGCWTCRLRRKKCDENREGDSCHTCIRLTIACLGWGPKRPEWMRDKQAVEAYKADIKAQLTRAGLIRGQPRPSLLAPGGAHGLRHRYPTPPPPHRRATDGGALADFDAAGEYPYPYPYADAYAYAQPRHDSLNLYHAMPGTNGNGNGNGAFYGLPGLAYSDPGLAPLPPPHSALPQPAPTDFDDAGLFAYPTPPPAPTDGAIPALDFDFAQLGAAGDCAFDFAVRAAESEPEPESLPPPHFAGHSSLQDNHCVYYFAHVRRVQHLFAGAAVANATCSMVLQDPRGATTHAVCALASLHYTRLRVAHGLEAPDADPSTATSKFFHDEAYFNLHQAQQARGAYAAGDALAALHLVWYSQLSGGATDWQPVFAVACDWLAQQTDLLGSDNPKLALQHLPEDGQLIVKLTFWVDIFSSLTVMRPPKYMALYKRLFGDLAQWPGELRMDALTGCPEEVLLGIAEVSTLAHWKAAEKRKGTLSNRELIRRGDEIEQRLRKSAASPARGEPDMTPLHPTLAQADPEAAAAPPFPSPEARQLVAKIFAEAVLLYLHTVLSDSNPGVPEISTSVNTIVQYLGQLPPSEVDRALVFPICLAGCMTDDSTLRDFLKGRLQALDESLGNIMRTRLLMEAVWQRRDVSGATVDWRETMRDRGLNLLLL
ncbi:fungal-specific transcription factor domain-containing protein [Mycena belliarum]|uniref:Fungal-specific transcription factor domain-containing protein n=1 Tax=Mycena belliarum TaxID=1033014 RepID=A0AAD6XVS8_9AGAR|nr:fungal-specific transcription factor domain-containing protein [Mycena belliae]